MVEAVETVRKKCLSGAQMTHFPVLQEAAHRPRQLEETRYLVVAEMNG